MGVAQVVVAVEVGVLPIGEPPAGESGSQYIWVWDVVSNILQKYFRWSFDMPCQIVVALSLPQMEASMRVGTSTGNVPASADVTSSKSRHQLEKNR